MASGLMSPDHVTDDGTLVEAWASLKSFRPKGAPVTDSNGWSDFRGQTRGNETHASTTDPESLLARKGNGQEAKRCFSGHAMMENRNGLLVDVRPFAGPCAMSQVRRTRVEQIFSWMKKVEGLRRSRWRGAARTQHAAFLIGTAYNRLRVARLTVKPEETPRTWRLARIGSLPPSTGHGHGYVQQSVFQRPGSPVEVEGVSSRAKGALVACTCCSVGEDLDGVRAQ